MRPEHDLRSCLLALGLLAAASTSAAPASPSLPAGSPVGVSPGDREVPPCVCSPATGLPASGGFVYHCRCGALSCVVTGVQGGPHHLVCGDN
jgi:hypothetical protein